MKNEEDARKEAEEEEVRQNFMREDQARRNQEQLEKARLRGKHALEKEIITEVIVHSLEHWL